MVDGQLRFTTVVLAASLAVSHLGAGRLSASPAPDVENPEVVASRTAQTHTVPRATGKIVIDGRIDEPAWRDAAAIAVTIETGPAENQPSGVETVAYLSYDDDFVYAAFRAHDPDPSAIRARLADRDTAFDDDFVGLVLDTFNDGRRAFEFFVNPLGVQMDLFNDDVNGGEDASWDAIWASAGHITAAGYEVEIAIPGSSLRFPPGTATKTWGVDLLRFRPRVDRQRISSQPLDRNISCYVCQFSKLEGFAGLSPGRNLELAPTLVGGRTDRRTDFPHGELLTGDEDADLGVTARWGITPNLILNAAINPDFSQVEADSAQLEVNTQFALFFPERRPFFLEGADFFSSPFTAVFTRNVADPDWGIKVSGKQGPYALGSFVARDALTNLLLPGAEGSRAVSLPFESTSAALRLRRDLSDSSNVGLIATARRGDGYESLLGGLDGRWQLDDNNRVVAQWLTSRTDEPAALGPGHRSGLADEAWRIHYSHDSRNWWGIARYEEVGPEFRADLGFMPRVGYTQALAGGGHVWHGGKDSWFSRMWWGGDWDRTSKSNGELLEEEWESWWEVSFAKESYVSLDAGVRERVFRGQSFDEQFLNTFFETRPSGDLYLSLQANFGDDIDFANTSPTFRRAGRKRIVRPAFTWKPGRSLRATLSYELNALEVAGGELFDARLTELRLVYQLNLRTFVRLVTQHTRLTREPGLYSFPVSRDSEDLFNELLFSYKINPQTVLFLGYSDGYFGANEQDPANGSPDHLDLTQTSRTFFIKLGYAWLP